MDLSSTNEALQDNSALAGTQELTKTEGAGASDAVCTYTYGRHVRLYMYRSIFLSVFSSLTQCYLAVCWSIGLPAG